jgi:hypothetical protein
MAFVLCAVFIAFRQAFLRRFVRPGQTKSQVQLLMGSPQKVVQYQSDVDCETWKFAFGDVHFRGDRCMGTNLGLNVRE